MRALASGLVLVGALCALPGAVAGPTALDFESPGQVGINAVEQRALVQALEMAGLYWSDLGFHKDVGQSAAKPETVRSALADPIDWIRRIDRRASALSHETLGAMGTLPDGAMWSVVTAKPVAAASPDGLTERLTMVLAGAALTAEQADAVNGLPEQARTALAELVNPAGASLTDAAVALEALFGRLSGDEQALLRAWGLRHVLAPDEAFPRFTPRDLSIDDDVAAKRAGGRDPTRAVLEVLAKVPRAELSVVADRLRAIAVRIARVLASAPPIAADLPLGEDTNGAVQGKILMRLRTTMGDILIGGPGDNVYGALTGAAIIIDPGGNDTYHDGATGIEGRSGQRIRLVIDARGNDRYVATQPYSQGGALLGVSILVDQSGNDRYEATLVAQGAAVAGVGVCIDQGGDDTYTLERHGQGAAIGGVGLLHDAAGTDRYTVVTFGQAFARTNGVGVLVDGGGDDIYQGGGQYPYLPQAPEHSYSHCQGYAIGVREYQFGGGVAILLDRAGNDTYRASMHAQGAATWYSLGALVDLAGDDTYEAVFNAQGAAVHQACGYLIDKAGADTYTLASDHDREGLGQGCSHDFAVGVLHDQGGDDVYTARAAAQGVGLTTSVGVLIDRDGDDQYRGETGHLQGAGRRNRQMPSLGVLVDGGGTDVYSTGRPNGGAWQTSDLGVGIDVGAAGVTPLPPVGAGGRSGDQPLPPNPLPIKPADAELTQAAFEALFAVASQWDSGESRPKVRAAKDELIAWGRRALGWLGGKLAIWNGPTMWAVDDVLTGIAKTDRAEVENFLRWAMGHPHPLYRVTGTMIGAHLGVAGADAAAQKLLTEPGFVRFGAVAAGLLRVESAVPLIAQAAGARDETEAALAIQALGRIGTPACDAPILAGLGHSSFLVRDAAARAAGRVGARLVPALMNAVTATKFVEQKTVWQLRAIAWAEPKLLAPIVPWLIERLDHAQPAIRVAVAETLAETGDARAKAAIVARLEGGTETSGSVIRALQIASERVQRLRPRRCEVPLHSGVVVYPDFFGGG